MGVRLALLAVCVAAIAVLAGRLGDQDGCRDARRAVYAAALGGTAPPAAQLRTLRADCHDVDELSAAGDDAGQPLRSPLVTTSAPPR